MQSKPLSINPYYTISTNGEVRTKTGNIARSYETSDHISIAISNRGKCTFNLAELVLETFVRPRLSPYDTVGYKDGNYKNVSLENLEWRTIEPAPRTPFTKAILTFSQEGKHNIFIGKHYSYEDSLKAFNMYSDMNYKSTNEMVQMIVPRDFSCSHFTPCA